MHARKNSPKHVLALHCGFQTLIANVAGAYARRVRKKAPFGLSSSFARTGIYRPKRFTTLAIEKCIAIKRHGAAYGIGLARQSSTMLFGPGEDYFDFSPSTRLVSADSLPSLRAFIVCVHVVFCPGSRHCSSPLYFFSFTYCFVFQNSLSGKCLLPRIVAVSGSMYGMLMALSPACLTTCLLYSSLLACRMHASR